MNSGRVVVGSNIRKPSKETVSAYMAGELCEILQVYRWTAGDFLRQAGILQGSRRGDSVRPTRQGPCARRHSKQSLPLFSTRRLDLLYGSLTAVNGRVEIIGN